MCVVSMITDHYKDRWSQQRTISELEWLEYQTLKQKAHLYDKQTNQPHCEKPDLEAWEKEILKLVRKQIETK